MKRLFCIISAALLTAALITGCQQQSRKQPKPADITAKLQSSQKFPEMMAVTKDRLKDFYTGIDAGTVKGFSAYICSSYASPDEVAVFQCDSSADADKVKAAVQDRIDSRKSTFENYGATKAQDFKNCVFEENGNYVILAVTGDNTAAKKTIDSFF
jgi:hypothetical protein